jgi:NADH-quinone oxidoreductase subunit N
MPAQAQEIAALLPILIPALGGVWILVVVAALGDREVARPAAHAMALLGLSAAAAVVLLSAGLRFELLGGALLIDRQALAFHLIFVTVAALTLLASVRHLQAARAAHGEFYALILFAVSGMTMMAATDNLLTIFLGLEVLSISLYVLAGFARDEAFSIEGALKYFLLGAFSTGFFLYGIALFYGVTGRIDLGGIASHLAAAHGDPVDPLILAGAALLLVGLAFKIAAVPFHFWAPDVYQGSLTPVSGFMAAGTKAAAFAALLRVVELGLSDPPVRAKWMAILSGLSVLSMVVANLVALAQQNIKRMLAYSSIANAGYLLLAVAAGARTGRETSVVLFYLAAYALMTVGAFSVAALVGRAGNENDNEDEGQGYTIASYAGLGRRRPWLAAAMAIFMLSLTGIPPTAGFMGKFYIFKSAVDAGLYGLAGTGLVVSVVAAFYYLRVVVQMYLRDPGPSPAPGPLTAAESLGILAAAGGTIWIGLFPAALFDFVQRAL